MHASYINRFDIETTQIHVLVYKHAKPDIR